MNISSGYQNQQVGARHSFLWDAEHCNIEKVRQYLLDNPHIDKELLGKALFAATYSKFLRKIRTNGHAYPQRPMLQSEIC